MHCNHGLSSIRLDNSFEAQNSQTEHKSKQTANLGQILAFRYRKGVNAITVQ